MHKTKRHDPKTITVLLHEPYSNINQLVNALKATPVMATHNTYSDDVNLRRFSSCTRDVPMRFCRSISSRTPLRSTLSVCATHAPS